MYFSYFLTLWRVQISTLDLESVFSRSKSPKYYGHICPGMYKYDVGKSSEHAIEDQNFFRLQLNYPRSIDSNSTFLQVMMTKS